MNEKKPPLKNMVHANLPEALFKEFEAYKIKYGFKTQTELLRAIIRAFFKGKMDKK